MKKIIKVISTVGISFVAVTALNTLNAEELQAPDKEVTNFEKEHNEEESKKVEKMVSDTFIVLKMEEEGENEK